MAVTKTTNPEIAKTLLAWRKNTRRERLGLSKELGVSKTSVSNWELGLNEPAVEVLLKLARLADGPYQTAFLRLAKEKSGLSGEAIASMAEMAAVRPKAKRGPQRRCDQIPIVAGFAGAGPGYHSEEEEIEGELAVPAGLCPNPAETRCIRIQGDSMEPTISNGAFVAVDRSERRSDKLVDKIVAAFNATEGVKVKRLMLFEGKKVLVSDKRGYPNVDLEPDWEIVGRVVWWIQTG